MIIPELEHYLTWQYARQGSCAVSEVDMDKVSEMAVINPTRFKAANAARVPGNTEYANAVRVVFEGSGATRMALLSRTEGWRTVRGILEALSDGGDRNAADVLKACFRGTPPKPPTLTFK